MRRILWRVGGRLFAVLAKRARKWRAHQSELYFALQSEKFFRRLKGAPRDV